ncbi:MAG: transposase [Prolixibacteraceae bacterium]|nr:transposase [Prolixibacteraceae bacterium]
MEVEFLRRFYQHILPYQFVKIRYYGLLSNKQKQANPLQAANHSESKRKEKNQERIVRMTGFDQYQCPFCKTGIMNTVELLPKICPPTNILYKETRLLYDFLYIDLIIKKHLPVRQTARNRIVWPKIRQMK